MLFLASLGCGGPETVGEPPRVAGEGEEEPVGQVGQGGTTRLALPASLEPACLNPYLAGCASAEALTGVVFEAPLAVGPGVEYRPLLAQEVPSYEAGTLALNPFTVELRLREGLAFSDGAPLTSADVKWTYESASRLEAPAPLYSGFQRLSRVETPDERTARLVFDGPYAPWRELLAAPILPRHVYEGEDLGELTLNENPVGSGPFVFEERINGNLSFSENTEYWIEEPALPNLEGLRIDFTDPAEAISTGRADFAFLTGSETRLPGDFLRAAAAPTRVEQLLINSRTLESRGSRMYVARAVDRGRIAEAFPGASVAESFVPPQFAAGYLPVWEGYGGAPSGEAPPELPATLDLVYPEGVGVDQARREVADSVVSDLASAGLEAEARAVPPEKFYGEVLPDGDFDLALFAVGAPAGYGALVPSLPPDSANALSGSLSILDVQSRARAEAQERMAAEAALLPLFVWQDAYAWSSTLSGPRPELPYRGLLSDVRDWGFYK